MVWETLRPAVRRDRIDMEFLRCALAAGLNRNSNCIDAGAHRGDLLEDMVRIAPRGAHIAFEPLPAFAAQIRSRFAGVRVEEIALWNCEGTASFTHVRAEPALSGLRVTTPPHNEVEQLSVRTARLDDLIPRDMPVALIKIDVEGAEHQLLQGAHETLARWRPILHFEHHQAAKAFGTTSRDVYELLTGPLEYRIFDLRGRGPYTFAEFQDAEARQVTNFLARV